VSDTDKRQNPFPMNSGNGFFFGGKHGDVSHASFVEVRWKQGDVSCASFVREEGSMRYVPTLPFICKKRKLDFRVEFVKCSFLNNDMEGFM
jgi:hypothetical protein